jgi:hypothetical protein
MRDAIPRKQPTHTRIETEAGGEAVIRLHREPMKRRKTKKITRGLAYVKNKLYLCGRKEPRMDGRNNIPGNGHSRHIMPGQGTNRKITAVSQTRQ